jgi:hypothetical protein
VEIVLSPLGDVADIKLADARAEGGRVKANARRPVSLRKDDAAPTPGEIRAAGVSRAMPIGKPRSQADRESDLELGNASVEDVLRYYEANRNFAVLIVFGMAAWYRIQIGSHIGAVAQIVLDRQV